jgi:Ca2+-binding RTX toxin-like protein
VAERPNSPRRLVRAAISQIVSNLTGSQVWATVQNNVTTVLRNGTGQAISVDMSAAPPQQGAVKVDRPWNLDLKVSVASAAASFIGGRLADAIHKFETVGGQIGAAMGQTYAAMNSAAMMIQYGVNPLTFAVAVIAIAVWRLIGGFIGSLFGGKPRSGADLIWSDAEGKFVAANVWSKNRGSADAARSMADSAAGLVNQVISVSRAQLLSPRETNVGAFGTNGRDFTYRPLGLGGGVVAKSSRDIGEIVAHGQYALLSSVVNRLAGGDVWIKRALLGVVTQVEASGGSGAFDPNALAGGIIAAQDYARYLQNRDKVAALIAADPQSAVSLGWVATLSLASELGLDRRQATDWIGGWNVFLDESADRVLNGVALPASSMFALHYGEHNARLFVFQAADGSILGLTGDTIESDRKSKIFGTAAADLIVVERATWTSTRSITEDVIVDQGVFRHPLSGVYISVNQTFAGAPVNIASGVTLVAANRVSVTYDVNTATNGWRVQNAANLSFNGTLLSSGPSPEIRVAAFIDGGAGADTIVGGDLGNDLLGGDGDDLLVGGALDDWLFGGAGSDRLFAGGIDYTITDVTALEALSVSMDSGNGDLLDGGEGDDLLVGGRGSDWLKGGAGVDRLIGGAGGDILEGGAGDDRGANGEARLLGGAGSDQYVFGYGDAQDVVFDEQGGGAGINDSASRRYERIQQGLERRNWAGDGSYEADGTVKGGEDAIVFGAGITLRNLRMQRVGDSLVIALKNADEVLTGDTLTIANWFEDVNRVEWLRFANGEDIRIGDMSSFIVGTDNDDVIIGTAGADFIVGAAGNDFIRALAGDDFAFGGKGRDQVFGDEDNDFVVGGDDDDRVNGGDGNDTVFGDAGNDDVAGGRGADILAGGRGDDTIAGGEGDDIIRYARGDGADIIYDSLGDLNSGAWELIYSAPISGTGGTFHGGFAAIDAEIRRGDEVIWREGEWFGRFHWDAATKKLYRHRGGSAEAFDSGDNDAIEFAVGIDIQDLILRQNGEDVEIAIAQDGQAQTFDQIKDRLTLKGWYGGNSRSIETFAFASTGRHRVADMALHGGATDAADTLAGGIGADWITGRDGDDLIDGGDGHDILSGNQGADTILAGFGNDVLFGGADSDVLNGGAGADQLIGGTGLDTASYRGGTGPIRAILADAAQNGGDAAGDVYNSIENLEGSDHADLLAGDANQNVLRGLGGNDTLIGGAGDDVYEIELGHGHDVIAEGDLIAEEMIRADGSFNDALFYIEWNLVHVAQADPGELYGFARYEYQLTVRRHQTGEVVYASRSGIDFLSYGIPMDGVPSPASWPIFEGQLQGGFARTDAASGSLRVARTIAGAGEGGVDTIELGAGISLSDLTFAREGNDLRVTVDGATAVLIRGQFVAASRVERLQLRDGVVVDLTALRLPGDATRSGADMIFGSGGADVLAGGDHDDVIAGGGGGDWLSGDAGDDTLEGGAGADTLDGGADSVSAGVAITATQSARGDTIRYQGSDAGVGVSLITGAASGGHAAGDVLIGIENIQGSRFGDTLQGNAGANQLWGLGGDDTLSGGAGDDVLIGGDDQDLLVGEAGDDNLSGEDGHDQLWGGDGRDVLSGGAGDDGLNGDAGDDMITAGVGNDWARGGAGKDTIGGDAGNDRLDGDDGDDALDGGDGADTLYGGAGADTLQGGAGNDRLEGGAGDDVYVFDANGGSDTIFDPDGKLRIVLSGANADQTWLSRQGDDLRIGLIGSTATLRVEGFFTGPVRMREIVSDSGSLFFGPTQSHASGLVNVMTQASPGTPSSMLGAAKALLGKYWFAGNKSAPTAPNQQLTALEDAPGGLAGAISAIDPDENITAHTLVDAPRNGVVALNAATGVWTYTPNANWWGDESFSFKVRDADGQETTQRVTLTVQSVNDAPSDILTSGALTTPEQRSAPLSATEGAQQGRAITRFTALDVDTALDPTESHTFTLVNDAGGRFRLVDGELQVGLAHLIDFEQAQSHTIRVRATDRGGLSFEKDFIVAVTNVNEAPLAPTLLGSSALVVTETTPTAPAPTGVIAAFDLRDRDVGQAVALSIVQDSLGLFEVSGTGLRRKSGAVIDFETLAAAGWTLSDVDSDGAKEIAYAIRVAASDGTFTTESGEIIFRLEDVNEAPSDIQLIAPANIIAERDRAALGINKPRVAIARFSASDPDRAVAAGGAPGFRDIAFAVVGDPRFSFEGDQLFLNADASLDFESSPTFTLDIRATDLGGQGLSVTRAFTFTLSDADDYWYGTSGADTLAGAAGRDIMVGGLGADTVRGQAGNDDLAGEDGADRLEGGLGADLLDGGRDNDQLLGGDGADTLRGGEGDDVLDGGVGGDRFAGGAGVDTLTYANAAAAVTVSLATRTGQSGEAQGDVFEDGFERLVGSAFNDTMTGSSATETIDGGAGGDTLLGGGGADHLIGSSGDDLLIGDVGVDSLDGGDGNDTLFGGAGSDTLRGGDGNDVLNAQEGGDVLEGGRGADIMDGAEGSDAYVIGFDTGADIIRDYDPDGADRDTLNVDAQVFDRAWLWFERVTNAGAPSPTGSDMLISILDTTSSVRVEGWFGTPPPANRKLEFVIAGTQVAIDVDALTFLMAGQTKPTSRAAHATLLDVNGAYGSRWADLWGVNAAPILQPLTAQPVDEDVELLVPIVATDDYTNTDQLTFGFEAYRDAALTQRDDSLLQRRPSVEEGGTLLRLRVRENFSGDLWLRVTAQDLTQRTSSPQIVRVTVRPVVDAPSLTATATSGTFDGAASERPTLNIAAALRDLDGSETLRIEVAGLHASLSLSVGTRDSSGVWTLTKAQADAGVQIIGPAGWAADQTFTVRAISRETASDLEPVVSVQNLSVPINARPTSIGLSSSTVNENSTHNTVVGTLSNIDPDGADSPIYTLLDSAGGRFQIANGNQIVVSSSAALNFEAAANHLIRVRVTDRGGAGLSHDSDITLSVNNLNEAPTALTITTLAFDENVAGATVARFTLDDPDRVAAFRTYGIAVLAGTTGETVDTRYEVVNVRIENDRILGDVRLRAGQSLNFEDATNRQLRLRAIDSNLVANQLTTGFTLNLQNVNEAPGNVSLSHSVALRPEGLVGGNGDGLVLMSAIDEDASQAVSYQIVSVDVAAAANWFDISGNLLRLRPSAPVDFESLPWSTATDSNGNGWREAVITVQVRAWDGALASPTTTALTVRIEDRNDPITRVWADRNLAFNENTGAHGLAWFGRDDADKWDGVTFSLLNDADGRFALDPSGLLRSGRRGLLNFEDGGGHWITVRATDNHGASRDENFWVSIADVNETPTFVTPWSNWWGESANALVMFENQGPGHHLGRLRGVDPDHPWLWHGQFRFELVNASAPFTVASDGNVWAQFSADHEAHIVHWIEVRIIDNHGASSIGRYNVHVANVWEAPAIWLSGAHAQAWDPDGGHVNYFTENTWALFEHVSYSWGYGEWDYHHSAWWAESPISVQVDPWSGFIHDPGAHHIFSGWNWYGGEHTHWFGGEYHTTVYAVDAQGQRSANSIRVGIGYGHRWQVPIVLDLDRDDHLDLLDIRQANVQFDMDGDGDKEAVGWVGRDDALLALDRDGDGLITNGLEIAFRDDINEAISDLEGLRRWDSDGDGFIDADDARYTDFRVWQDLNQDGVSQANELTTLAERGIRAINLTLTTTGETTRQVGESRKNVVYGTTEMLFSNGSTGLVGDVALAYAGNWEVRPLEGGATAPPPNVQQLMDAAAAAGQAQNGQPSVWAPPLGSPQPQGPASSGATSAGASGGQSAGSGTSAIASGQANGSTATSTGPSTSPTGPGSQPSGVGNATGLASIPAGGVLPPPPPPPGLLGPVVFDLNGDGFGLISRTASNVKFDALSDGQRVRIGWVDANDGILALDRDGDGQITHGREISFMDDLSGARSDLEGLRAFDTNLNGLFDRGDARFSEFVVWRDFNQDGVSQAGELASVFDSGIIAVNLTLQTTGQKTQGAVDNVLYATAQFVRSDRTLGQVGDVFLSFDQPETGGQAPAVDPKTIGIGEASDGKRSADTNAHRMKTPTDPTHDDYTDDGSTASGPKEASNVKRSADTNVHRAKGLTDPTSLDQDDVPASSAAGTPAFDAPEVARKGSRPPTMSLSDVVEPLSAATRAKPREFASKGEGQSWLDRSFGWLRRATGIGSDYAVKGDGALRDNLGVDQKTMIKIVDAMATFDAETGAADLGGDRDRERRERRTLITSLPEIRS